MDDERWFHLNDEQWAQIKGAFPPRRGTSGFERKISNRPAFEAVLYRARTGCPWRDLPGEYGDDHTISMRWRRWVRSGVPQRAMAAWYLEAAKRGELDLSLARVDSDARASAPARGRSPQKNGGDQALGRSRGGLSTKIHTVAVSEPQVLGLIKAVGGDRAYDSDASRRLIKAAGKEAVIPPRSNRREPADYDQEKYQGRHKVERLFNRLKG